MFSSISCVGLDGSIVESSSSGSHVEEQYGVDLGRFEFHFNETEEAFIRAACKSRSVRDILIDNCSRNVFAKRSAGE